MNLSKKRDPRAWKKWATAGAVQDCSHGFSTDGPTPPPANGDICVNGELMMVTSSIGSNAIERWVKKVAKRSGQPVDWHWNGGRAHILALGDLERVKSAMAALMPEHDRLYAVVMKGYFPDYVAGKEFFPPHPDWLEEYRQAN